MKPKQIKPIIQAILLADHVYQDRLTGKYVIAGTFNSLLVGKPEIESDLEPQALTPQQAEIIKHAEFHHVGSPWFYLNLVEVRGAIELVLRFVSLRDEKPYFEGKVSVTNDDPNEAVEIASHLPRLPSRSGVYALEVLFENELLGFLRVNVVEVASNDNA